MKLSERLLTLVNFINDPQAIICDIGTDHALLAIYLVNHHRIKEVYATDILLAPLEQGKNNIKRYCQNPQAIHLLLSDGFQQLPVNIIFTYAVIAGLGAHSIVKILQKESNIIITKYLFCPTDNPYLIRQWVQENNYFLQDEKIVYENGIYYEIILINKEEGHKIIDEFDIFFGPILRKKNEKNFQKKWRIQQKKYQDLLTKIPVNHPNYQNNFSWLTLINEVLKNEN